MGVREALKEDEMKVTQTEGLGSWVWVWGFGTLGCNFATESMRSPTPRVLQWGIRPDQKPEI